MARIRISNVIPSRIDEDAPFVLASLDFANRASSQITLLPPLALLCPLHVCRLSILPPLKPPHAHHDSRQGAFLCRKSRSSLPRHSLAMKFELISRLCTSDMYRNRLSRTIFRLASNQNLLSRSIVLEHICIGEESGDCNEAAGKKW